MAKPSRLEKRLQKLFARAETWVSLWGLTRLLRDFSIEFSDDLGSDLGRCDLRARKIQLHGVLLLDANEALLFEALCHELAHAVTAARYGNRVEEHGVEWCEYMQRAGFTPRAVIPESCIARPSGPGPEEAWSVTE